MVLTDREIQTSIEQDQIIIDPPPLENAYSSTSVDLTLDKNISQYNKPLSGVELTLDPSDPEYDHEEILSKHSTRVELDGSGYVFKPNKLILAWTAEYIHLKVHSKLAARIEGKSSLARLGIGVHVTAPIIHSGFEGQIRLEMFNHGLLPVRLRARMRICQLVFEQTLGTPVRGYKGRFAGQTAEKKG
jgi:dCTP deaminase